MEEVAGLLIELRTSLGLLADPLETLRRWLDVVAGALIQLSTLLTEVLSFTEALQGWLDKLQAFLDPLPTRALRKYYAFFVFAKQSTEHCSSPAKKIILF